MSSSRRLLPLAAGVLALVLPAAASAQRVELTPFAGYRFGGDFEAQGLGHLDLEVEDSSAYGVVLGFAVARDLFLELSFSRQETELLEDEGGLFEPDEPIFDLDLDVAHVGVSYQWVPGQVRPFVSGSIGVTRLRPQGGGIDGLLESDERFSAAFGGGVKILFTDNVGVRLEGRGLWTFLDEDDDDFCNDCFVRDEDVLEQIEARAGLVLAF